MSPLEHDDLPVVDLDQVAQRLDPDRVALTERHGVELLAAGGAEHVHHPGQDTFFGHHRVDLGLEPGAQLHQLGPVADQLPQLTDRRRGDPRLRQTTQAQHVGQIGGVDHVVLDPPIPPVQRLRVGQMHRRAQLLQQVHHPVPAVGGLDHHLRARTSLSQPPPRSPPGRCRPAPPTAAHPRHSTRTTTDRRRWKSIPTYSRSIGASSSSTEGLGCGNPESSTTRTPRGAEAPLLHRIS